MSRSTMPKRTEDSSDTAAAPGGVAAVDRALSLLLAFGDGDRSLSLAELAQRTGQYKSTVLRLLASLLHAGFMQRLDDGRYRLGPALARLSKRYAGSFALEEQVMPVLRDLVDATQESAAFHVRQGDQRLCLYRVDSRQTLRDTTRAGDLLPLERGAGGRVLTAFSGARGELAERIRRERVIGLQDDRSRGLSGVSAPVFDADGRLMGALTLTMPTMRYTERHLKPVRAAAKRLTEALGGRFEPAD
jgi:DNA-binding IclR family transcriptional regulator